MRDLKGRRQAEILRIIRPSRAAAAAGASPGMVLTTTMFWAASQEATPSLKMFFSRPAKLCSTGFGAGHK